MVDERRLRQVSCGRQLSDLMQPSGEDLPLSRSNELRKTREACSVLSMRTPIETSGQ
jgi:hypothetical protein